MDLEVSAHSLQDGTSSDKDCAGESNQEYKAVLSSELLGLGEDSSQSSASHRILSFKDKAPAPKGDTVNNLKVLYSASALSKSNKSSKLVSRVVPSAPSRILDAPDLLDDY